MSERARGRRQTGAPAAPFEGPALSVSGLSVEFWVGGQWAAAAKHVTYDLMPGKVLAIVGESGSGKSTSSMAIMGLLPKNARISGSAKLAGRELVNAPVEVLRKVRGEGIAAIFQEPMTALNPVYTIGFQISETLLTHRHGMTRKQARERAIELLGLVEMPDPEKAYNSYPHQLSGGQRQRAMIAQSISLDPRVLIADEPTTALDVTVQAEILDLLRNLHQKLDSAIILITHDMGVVADMADDVMVMKDGDVVEHGPVGQIFGKAEHPYTRALMASVPHLGLGEAGADAAARHEAGTAALVLDKLCIDYPKRGRVPAFRAVSDASLTIQPGEVLGLVGESGSGKTTIARAIVGLIPVAEGALRVAGQDMVGVDPKELKAVRRKLGIVFQDPGSSLNPRWPVGESIGEPLQLAGHDKADIATRVTDLLDLVELPRDFRNRYPHELSGGQRQRIGIARALALDPTVLVADEPTSALDVSVQARVLELLQNIQKEKQFATLFVTHDLAVVDLLADRIAVMQHGKIVEQGTKEQILRNPQDPYTQRLIAAVPVPDPAEQRVRREARAALLAAQE
ncbi:ABC transporter ATP-binding protein [Microbacterium terricola]|uniref:Oligopeptide ABC transporter, ATP-binding protein n=1 Tax=Microbacterium terricola TaxID=344163 RepID=A0ABM8DZU5_9MICO|nr:ABC transporter ATP-binding protein [Microbacterium terricola]UYK41576.1 ABC transporter ATP-binding protein [Microbacterium terricola]BDV31020.1 putative oligopeptide ABC transporter, ATP-binding protein [Microbacterium terricola]